MRIDVLTLFPGIFPDILGESITGIAIRNEAIDVRLVDIRDFAFNKHRTTDDYPYGGGAGMVMKPEPVHEALTYLEVGEGTPVVYFTPQGRLLKQDVVQEYCGTERIVMICGHYKELDQRIRDRWVTDELSIGDYVLSGGELPALVMIDALARLQDGVLNDLDSALTDSHQKGLLGCAHYTRPPVFEGMKVPDVLLSGNHAFIEKWREEDSLRRTREVRPELLDSQ